MGAARTGLPHYTNEQGGSLYAARIASIEPFKFGPPHSVKVRFSEFKKEMNLIGSWVDQNRPSVGGYIVVKDSQDGDTACYFEDAKVFEKKNKRA